MKYKNYRKVFRKEGKFELDKVVGIELVDTAARERKGNDKPFSQYTEGTKVCGHSE